MTKDDYLTFPNTMIQAQLFRSLRVGSMLRVSHADGSREARVVRVVPDKHMPKVWAVKKNAVQNTWTQPRRIYPAELMVWRSALSFDELAPRLQQKELDSKVVIPDDIDPDDVIKVTFRRVIEVEQTWTRRDFERRLRDLGAKELIQDEDLELTNSRDMVEVVKVERHRC